MSTTQRATLWATRLALFLFTWWCAALTWPASTRHSPWPYEVRFDLQRLQQQIGAVAGRNGSWPDVARDPQWADHFFAGEFDGGHSFWIEDGVIVELFRGPESTPAPLRLPTGKFDPAQTVPPNFILYSKGDNGIDDGGSGDDITPFDIDVRDGYYWKTYWPLARVLTPLLVMTATFMWWRAFVDGRWKPVRARIALATTAVFAIVVAWLITNGDSLDPGRFKFFQHANLAHTVVVAVLITTIVDPMLCWAVRKWASRERAFNGRCPSCNYDLAGLPSGTCPECGATASPP